MKNLEHIAAIPIKSQSITVSLRQMSEYYKMDFGEIPNNYLYYVKCFKSYKGLKKNERYLKYDKTVKEMYRNPIFVGSMDHYDW